MVMAAIEAGYGGAKAAIGLLQGFYSLKSEAEKNKAIVDIQRHVVETQHALSVADQSYFASLKEIDALKAEVMRLKDWSAEKERYERADAGQGTIAYRQKAGMEDGESAHWLCPNCYTNDKKSFLQPEMRVPRATVLVCPACDTELYTRGHREKEHSSRGRGR